MIIRKFLPLQAQLKRLKHFQTFILPSALVGVLLVAVASQAQMAKGANKFLGNITTNGAVRSDFLTYWNQITPENETKWGSVEGTRGSFNWAGGDRVKTFAETNNIPWKFHTLVWGSQYPGWITGLSQADQLTEITKWFDAATQRYPNVNMIDVVNEGYPQHAPAPYKAALGGDGTSGYDWIMKSFQMARQRWPKAILIYNDYNNIEWSAEIAWTPTMVNAIKKAGAPIDAIGCQSHDCYRFDSSVIRKNIDSLAKKTGLPIFITEFDIPDANDATQLATMQKLFTMFWNHPKVVGITYWGYLVGSTWKTGTGLLNTNGTERPALTWLKNFVASNKNPPNDFPNFLNRNTGTISPNVVAISQGPVTRKGPGLMEIFNLQGRMIKSLYVNDRTINASMMPSRGSYVVKLDGTYAGIFANVR
jgi:endo-1,4-beta-xylanase